MLRQGASLQEIAAILRHRSIETTTIYASEIHTFADLKGKRLTMPEPGSVAFVGITEAFKAVGWDIKKDFSKVLQLKKSDGISALKDGTVDVYADLMGPGHPLPTELARTKDVRFIPVPQDIVKQVTASGLSEEFTIEPNLYKGQTEAINSFGQGGGVHTFAAFPEEDAYQLVKTYWDDKEAANKVHAIIATTTLENQGRLYKKTVAPIHSGALRYFKEVGAIKD
jgi:hypothetical protein